MLVKYNAKVLLLRKDKPSGKTRTHPKLSVFARAQGEAEDQPAGLRQYAEDLRRGFNADSGRKNLFEMGSMNFCGGSDGTGNG